MVFPAEWQNQFGLPYNEHKQSLAGGGNELSALVPLMAQSIHIVRHIAVAAARAGVSRVALFGAGGFGHFGNIVVAESVRVRPPRRQRCRKDWR